MASVNSVARRTQVNPGSGELALVILAVAVQPNRPGFQIAVAACLSSNVNLNNYSSWG